MPTRLGLIGRIALAAAALGFVPGAAAAQTAQGPALSGILFASFSYLLPVTAEPLPNQVSSAFAVDRAYITLRAPVSEHASVRITTDVYQTTEAVSTGYAIRAKYAYLQYDSPRRTDGAGVTGRLGILQSVVIDHVEQFWPRYVAQTAVERAGFFLSADAGAAAVLTLPRKRGEIYATIVNGPGYVSRERDRFKDVAARISLTPLAERTSASLFQTLTLTAWTYRGTTASAFVNGGAGQAGSVGQGLARNRVGVFLGLRGPRLIAGAELAQRSDEVENGANTTASPRRVGETTERLRSAFVVARPLAWLNASRHSSVGLIGRYDRGTVGTMIDAAGATTTNDYHTVIAGVFADLNPRLQLSLDYQEVLDGPLGRPSALPNQSKGYFAHVSATF